ncbi:tripartite tricarboxylate transporter substrate binding protein [soil metagenome]
MSAARPMDGIGRRRVLGAIGGAAASLALPSMPAFAKGFPERPVKIVVPFSPGGTTDLAARLLAEMLQERTGATFVIDNKPGAGAAIGIDAVARAPADGYTLLYGSDALLLGPLTRSNLSFSMADFAPIARVRVSSVYLAVDNKLPVNSVKELVALAKSKPGQLSYGTGGVATVLHIAGVQFTTRTGADLIHVPYKGVAPAVTDVVGGNLNMAWAGTVDVAGFEKSGALKVIGMTGERRSLALPNVPTMAESGYPGLVVVNWNGVLAPKATPPDVVKWLTENVAAVAGSDEFVKRGEKLEIEPGAMLQGAGFQTFLTETNERYRAVIKQANIKLTD